MEVGSPTLEQTEAKETNPTTQDGALVYPKDRLENLKFRAWLIRQARQDEKLQRAVRAKCKEDVLFLFNVILWTPDPRTDLKNLPFITYPYQDDYLKWLDERYKAGEDALTEKSRDMGASMLFLGFVYWKWLFDEGFNGLLGSYIEDMVDDTTINSHFGRLQYFLERTPSFILPEGFQMNLHRSSMKLKNPATGSMVVGYAPTERFSRAGRFSLVLADEFAFWKHARAAWIAMGDATKCRFVTSTPNGKGNQFSDLALKSNIKKTTLHWTLHPNKNQQWYENEKRRRTEVEIAQELDINYNKSVTGRVYPELDEYNFLEKQEYDPLQPLFVTWDFGKRDETAMIWLQANPKDGEVRIIDAFQKAQKAIDWFVPFVTGEVKSGKGFDYNDEELEMINRHKRWQAAKHYGDPTGTSEHQTSMTSVVEQLRKHNIHVMTTRKGFDYKSRIEKTKMLIRRLKIDKDLVELIDALQNARFPQRTEMSQATTDSPKPVHDWTSHYRSALEFFAINENLKKIRNGAIVNNVKAKMKSLGSSLDKFLDKKEQEILKGKGANPTYRKCV